MDTLGALLITALALLLIFGVCFTAVRVDDSGMSPTLRGGDIVFFSRIAKYLHSPARGDIIARRGADGSLLLGRIVALPGETVDMSGGSIYIDGVLLNEETYRPAACPELDGSYMLPAGCYLVLPDARGDMAVDIFSMTVALEDIYGRAALRVYPSGRFCVFK